MKIAILTQPLYNNYGGVLQNYALQRYLQKLCHSPETIDYDLLAIPWHLRLLIGLKRFIFKYILRVKGISRVDPVQEGYEMHLRNDGEMVRFIEQYIHSRKGKWPLTPGFVRNNPYGAYIVGSDQVWRADYTAHLMNYFLDFVNNPQIRKIAYAASFGVDVLDPKQYDIKKISCLLGRFDAVSVREKSGVSLCKEILGCKAEHVLDPTMLLTADDYENHLHLIRDESKYLVVYILDDTPQKRRVVELISQRMHLPVKYIGRHGSPILPSIESWLEGIMNARFVVTDSFHGSVFSILFEKDFITINNSVRGTTRITSLFEMMGISSQRMLSQNIMQIPEFAPIDYSIIRHRLAAERVKAANFLTSALQ